jgi:hypothetical protein
MYIIAGAATAHNILLAKICIVFVNIKHVRAQQMCQHET